MNTTYVFEPARYNGIDGFIVTRKIGGCYAGKAFGSTRESAVAALV